MPDIETLALFMTATLALNVTPGLDMLYVIGRTLTDGRVGGVISCFGISGGIGIHIVVLATGLGTILTTHPLAYDVIRGAGAVYLAILGINAIRHAEHNERQSNLVAAPTHVVFIQGVLTSLLNPKIALFFLAFLPQFVDPDRNAARQFALLGLLFVISGTLVNLAVVFGVDQVAHRTTSGSGRGVVYLKRGTGVLFLVLALRLALSHTP